jgi:hypothetical protein
MKKRSPTISLDDLLEPEVDLSDLIDEEPALAPKSEPHSMVLFWNMWTCKCGSVYWGPDYLTQTPMLKHPLKRRKGFEYTPTTKFAHPHIKRQVELHPRKLDACPGCIEPAQATAKVLLFLNSQPEVLTAQRQLTHQIHCKRCFRTAPEVRRLIAHEDAGYTCDECLGGTHGQVQTN